MRNAVYYSRGREASAAAGRSCRNKVADQEQAEVISLGEQPPSPTDGSKMSCLVTGADDIYGSSRKCPWEEALRKAFCAPPSLAGQLSVF